MGFFARRRARQGYLRDKAKLEAWMAGLVEGKSLAETKPDFEGITDEQLIEIIRRTLIKSGRWDLVEKVEAEIRGEEYEPKERLYPWLVTAILNGEMTREEAEAEHAKHKAELEAEAAAFDERMAREQAENEKELEEMERQHEAEMAQLRAEEAEEDAAWERQREADEAELAELMREIEDSKKHSQVFDRYFTEIQEAWEAGDEDRADELSRNYLEYLREHEPEDYAAVMKRMHVYEKEEEAWNSYVDDVEEAEEAGDYERLDQLIDRNAHLREDDELE